MDSEGYSEGISDLDLEMEYSEDTKKLSEVMLEMFGATVMLCFRLSFKSMTYITMQFEQEETGYIA